MVDATFDSSPVTPPTTCHTPIWLASRPRWRWSKNSGSSKRESSTFVAASRMRFCDSRVTLALSSTCWFSCTRLMIPTTNAMPPTVRCPAARHDPSTGGTCGQHRRGRAAALHRLPTQPGSGDNPEEGDEEEAPPVGLPNDAQRLAEEFGELLQRLLRRLRGDVRLYEVVRPVVTLGRLRVEIVVVVDALDEFWFCRFVLFHLASFAG